jgi:N-acetylglutamate synthase-like GNAT family acetyltransferase
MARHDSVPAVGVRQATAADAPAISAILHEAFSEYRRLYTDAGFAATAISAEHMQQRLTEGPVWVALVGDTMVGTAAVLEKGPDWYIRGMAVIPAARGHHIGEILLVRIEERAQENHVRRLFLSTTPFLHRAIRLYEKCGFRPTDDGPQDLFGTPLLVMEKLLIPAD